MSLREAAGRIVSWVIVFIAWSFWESTFRIVFQHPAWNLAASFQFLLWNLAPAILLALLLGMLHTAISAALLRMRPSASFLEPSAWALAVSLAMALLLDTSQSWNALPGFLQLRFGSGLHAGFLYAGALMGLILLLVVSVVLFRLLGRFLVSRKTVAFLLLLPLAVIAGIQLYRSSSVSAEANGPVKKVILISIDTLRADYVGAYGNANVHTPVLDGIAQQGARFEQAISSIPQTGPSHASMMTGLTPLSHGLHHNGFALSPRHHTLAQQLRDAGFETAGFISGIPLKTDFSGLDRGFQEYHDQLAPVDYISHTFYGRAIAPFFRRGLLRRGQATTDAALNWLSSHGNSNFFLFVHYFDPHYPYGKKDVEHFRGDPFIVRTGPEEIEKEKRLYASEVEYADQQVGRIIAFLQKADIYDQVLLIIVSDHGESLGEHNYYYDHDRYVYEQLVRVPLLVRNPSLVPAGTLIQPQVAVLDVYQTILAGAGVKPANKPEGQDLLALIKSVPEDYRQRSILSHSFYFGVHGLRTNEWKLIARKRRFELFDMARDPEELHNMYRLQKNVADELKVRLAKAMSGLATSEDATKDLTPEQLEDLRSLGYFQ